MKLAKLAKPRVVVALALVSCVLMRRNRRALTGMLVTTSVTFAATRVAKKLYPKARPRLFDHHERESFPSSHAAMSTGYLMSLLDGLDAWWALPLAVAAIAKVDASRVRDREHWPKDVLVGDLFGLAGAMLGAIAGRLLDRRRVHADEMHN